MVGKVLLERLYYEPSTGEIRWKEKTNKFKGRPYKKSNKIATTGGKNGYLEVAVMVNYVKYRMYAHRFAFLFMGEDMPKQVDHIDHDRSNNKWSNLASADSLSNGKNMSKSKANTSGVTGVTWDKAKNRWLAQIYVDGKYSSLGIFVQFADAVNARKNAEVLYGFHENHGS